MRLVRLWKEKGDWFATVEGRDFPRFWRKLQYTVNGGRMGYVWRLRSGQRVTYETETWLHDRVEERELEEKFG